MGGNLVKRSFNLNILLDYRKLNDYLALLMARFDWNNNLTNYHIIFALQKYQTTSVNLFLVLAGGECVIKICCFSVKIKGGCVSADTYQMVYSFLFIFHHRILTAKTLLLWWRTDLNKILTRKSKCD